LHPCTADCKVFTFTKTDHTEFTARVATVLVTENVEFDLDVLDSYVKATYPDLAQMFEFVQQKQYQWHIGCTVPQTKAQVTGAWMCGPVQTWSSTRQARP
jgi:hypothetical protein